MDPILTPAAARFHLRVGNNVTDEQLAPLIATAEETVSGFLGRPLIDAEKGWANLEALPAGIVHAIKLVLTDLYDNRAAPLADETALRRLIGRYQILSFG
jgi:Phage gp6-like head-tail connector protein